MLLMTNIDNVSCDSIPYLIDELMKKNVKNVHVVPAITKKGRNEYIFFIDCMEGQIEEVAEFMSMETGTLGIRIIENSHYPFDFVVKRMDAVLENAEKVIVWEGTLSFKIVLNKKGETLSVKSEYEEMKDLTVHLKNAGLNVSLYEVKQILEYHAVKMFKCSSSEEACEGLGGKLRLRSSRPGL